MKLVRKHARFGAVMIVLIVVLWIASGELSGIAETIEARQGTAKATLSTNYRALFADAIKFKGDPATIQGRRIQERTAETGAITTLQLERMVFETDPAFTVDALNTTAVDEMGNYLRNQKKDEMQREFSYKRYFQRDVTSDTAFGFAIPPDKLTREQVVEYLRKLDIVRTACYCVENAGVEALTELRFVAVDENMRLRGVPTARTQPEEAPFMSGEGLYFEVLGTEQALYNLLVGLQVPEKGGLRNRYFSVESFTFEKPDLLNPKDQLIEARLTIVAWRVNPDSSYPPDESQKASQQGTAGQPRKFNR